MTGAGYGTPPSLLHNLRHNKVLHEQVVLLAVLTADVPHVPTTGRARVERLAARFHRVTLTYGFVDAPNVPAALRALPPEYGLRLDPAQTVFSLGREKLFAFMARNAQRATTFFRIPPDRVFEIGMQVEL
jgi:KUP system potassium uptake protein